MYLPRTPWKADTVWIIVAKWSVLALILWPVWSCFRFHEHWRFVLQRLVFLAAFVVYLENETLVIREEVAKILGSRYQLMCWCVTVTKECNFTLFFFFSSFFLPSSPYSWGGARERLSPGCRGLPGRCADHGQWTGKSIVCYRVTSRIY